MPPTRRSRTSGGPAVKGSQKTLSFNNSKVTKTTSAKEEKPVLNPKATIELGHVTSEPAVLQQAKIEIASLRTEEEERAAKVTDAQIRKYWRECEKSRRAPRVHQEDLSVEEKILRLFDMSSHYGPCIGIARMKRWVRANKLGLAPPIEVLSVILKEEQKGNTSIERAYVDELMSSKFGTGEV